MSESIVKSGLPIEIVHYLETMCASLSIPVFTVEHQRTFSAADTQAVLPKDCLVQKTVTDRVADKLVAWTGVGDFRISHHTYKAANRTLGIGTTSEHVLNPRDVDAMQFYGMQPGMVSPFLIPGTPATKQLSALFLLDWSSYDMTQSVAISISLYKSLVVSLSGLDQMLRLYANTTYAAIPLYTL